MSVIILKRFPSPVGELLLGACAERLCLCGWAEEKTRGEVDRRLQRHFRAGFTEGTCNVISRAAAQLREYFEGRRREFDLTLELVGTPFQQRVWEVLRGIPYGQTISYAEEAARLGNPRAVRAVAVANAANPVAIIVPCHRVIGSNRKLVGYSAGLEAKRRLLTLEQPTGGIFCAR